jgi:antitoxin ParD1/3/4
MPSVNVSLPSPIADWVQEKVQTGEYASVTDYLSELVRTDRHHRLSGSSEEYRISDDEARDLTEAIAELAHGDLASEAEVTELFDRYRG